MKKIFIILTVLSLISCGKKRTFHIKAINAVTGEPYAGLAYGVSATKSSTNGEKQVYDHNGFLDANGEAFVTLKVRTGRTYNIGCTEPPNTCYVKDIHFTYAIQDDPSPTFQFEYAECANFKLEIHNINCLGSADEIKFKRTWLNGDTPDFFQTQLGCLNFVGEYFTLPIGNYKYDWQVTRNGVTTYHDSLFTLSENQYYTFVLNY